MLDILQHLGLKDLIHLDGEKYIDRTDASIFLSVDPRSIDANFASHPEILGAYKEWFNSNRVHRIGKRKLLTFQQLVLTSMYIRRSEMTDLLKYLFALYLESGKHIDMNDTNLIKLKDMISKNYWRTKYG